MLDPTLRGIIAATVLPLREDFEIDTPSLRRYLAWLLEEGVHGVAVNVDTGEGPHLTPKERLHVVRTAAEVVAGRVPLISGLAPASTARAGAAARDLGAAGADALLVFPSAAFRTVPLPASVPVDHYRTVGEVGGVPLVLFQLQEALGGVEFPVPVLARIARLPQVVAVKEATFRPEAFRKTVAALEDVEVSLLTGNDNFIHDSLCWGARGALIGFGTLATRLQVRMWDAHEAGDAERAAELGKEVQRLADVVFAPPVRHYRVRLKEALRLLGVIPRATIRPPLEPVTEEESATLRAAMAEARLL
ncbi:MAG: dihydrodipicolinate synthase family protein, partial [Planctomycetota bacterium]